MSGGLSQLDSGDSPTGGLRGGQYLYLGYSRREAALAVRYSGVREIIKEVAEVVAWSLV